MLVQFNPPVLKSASIRIPEDDPLNNHLNEVN